MPIVWFDGLDTYGSSADLSANYAYTTAPNYSAGAGRFGGGAARLDTTSNIESQGLFKSLSSADLYHQVGGAVKFNAMNPGPFIGFMTGLDWYETADKVHANVWLNSDRSITVMGDDRTTLATSASGLITSGVYYYIEARCYRHDTAGSIEVWINGALAVSATNVDTKDGNTGILAGFYQLGGFDTNLYVDDMYIASGSSFDVPIGDKRVDLLPPTADTAQADLLKSAGSDGYPLIDDTGGGNGDTDYIYGTTAGNKSEFDMADISINATIFGVAVIGRAKKTDTGAKTFKKYIKSAAAVGSGATVAPGSSNYDQTRDFFLTDPNTSAAWTVSGVNAAKIGIEILS